MTEGKSSLLTCWKAGDNVSISIQAKDFSGVKVPESFSFLQGSFLSCWLVFTWFTWFFELHAQKLAGALRYGRFGECHGAWLVAGGPQDHLVPWRTVVKVDGATVICFVF